MCLRFITECNKLEYQDPIARSVENLKTLPTSDTLQMYTFHEMLKELMMHTISTGFGNYNTKIKIRCTQFQQIWKTIQK